MAALWSATALLPHGWARNVRCTVADGLIALVETVVPGSPGDDVDRIMAE